jgi:hypothetical protein
MDTYGTITPATIIDIRLHRRVKGYGLYFAPRNLHPAPRPLTRLRFFLKCNRNSVAILQQSGSPGYADLVAIHLLAYTRSTEIPILSEYCADNDLYEEYLLNLATDSLTLMGAVKLLETKKRAALERKIYNAELNATIGAHLLKLWRETTIPEPPPKLRSVTFDELWELELSDEEIDIFSRIERQLQDGAQ